MRESFLYGRTFLSDADLNAQVGHWLATVANVRVHGTTKAVPAQRFATDEQPVLAALPTRPYRSLLLDPRDRRPAMRTSSTPEATSSVPHAVVERRSLETSAALASAGGEEA